MIIQRAWRRPRQLHRKRWKYVMDRIKYNPRIGIDMI